MNKIYISLILVILLGQSASIYAEDNKIVELKSMTVVGQVPGPDLWKVTNGENTLWILGILSPLPKRMEWNAKPIEKIIQNSQALINSPSVTADVGFFKALSLAKTAINIKKNPEKQKLSDVLPDNLYQQWLILKKKYLGNNKRIEKTRPIYASQKLYEKAIKKRGLKTTSEVTKKVRKIAKKNKLISINPKITIDLTQPKAALKKLKKTQLNDIECFSKKLNRLETDIENMAARAVAWSYGDIESIRSMPFPDDNLACNSAILNSEFASDIGLTDIPNRLRKIWLQEVKSALTTHKSTFALLSISNLLSEDSYLTDLRAAGYTIEEPQSD